MTGEKTSKYVGGDAGAGANVAPLAPKPWRMSDQSDVGTEDVPKEIQAALALCAESRGAAAAS